MGEPESFPAWSPDGTTIAFTRGFERGDMGDLWVIDLATLRAHKVTSSPAFDLGAGWSPDGSTIIFQRTADNAARIATVRPDGTGLDMLTSVHFDAGPVSSPSGTSIAFSSDRRSTFLPDLWSMAPDGTGVHRILDLGHASTAPERHPQAWALESVPPRDIGSEHGDLPLLCPREP